MNISRQPCVPVNGPLDHLAIDLSTRWRRKLFLSWIVVVRYARNPTRDLGDPVLMRLYLAVMTFAPPATAPNFFQSSYRLLPDRSTHLRFMFCIQSPVLHRPPSTPELPTTPGSNPSFMPSRCKSTIDPTLAICHDEMMQVLSCYILGSFRFVIQTDAAGESLECATAEGEGIA